MKQLYIKSDEFYFLKEPIFLISTKIIKKGCNKLMIAQLESPINIWFNDRIHRYSRVLLKPRYYFQNFNKLHARPITVNIASFDKQNINDFKLSKLEIIGFGDLYSNSNEDLINNFHE